MFTHKEENVWNQNWELLHYLQYIILELVYDATCCIYTTCDVIPYTFLLIKKIIFFLLFFSIKLLKKLRLYHLNHNYMQLYVYSKLHLRISDI